MWKLFTVLAAMPWRTSSFVDQNAILGQPDVTCSEETISFTIRTQQPFRGSIYIKGQHDSEVCRSVFLQNTRSEATFTVRIGDCGMLRMRQPGTISFMSVFVATFHPQLVTKIDRAYNVRCTYEHKNKLVDANLEIGGLPMENVEKTMQVYPNCQYTIREGNRDGPVVRSTSLGRTLFHLWECNNPRFGMLINNCFITDGVGNNAVKIIDERGCPIRGDIPPFGQLVYDTDLNMAYVAIEAFSFADRNSQQFRCEVNVCSKRDGDCVGLTPPNCPSIPRSGFRPNSIVDAEVNPTQVVATFQGELRSNNLGNTIIDGTLTPSIAPQQPIVIPNPLGSPEEFHHQPWRREQNSLDEEEHNDLPSFDNSTKIEESSAEFTWPTLGPHEVYHRDQPIDIHVMSTTPASAVKHKGDLRYRRLADNVFDVASEAIIVHQFDKIEPEALPIQSDDPSTVVEEKVTCLNRPAMIIVLLALAATTLMTLASIIYIFSDIFKKNKPSDHLEHGYPPSSTLSCISEDSQAPIIFTRRLGQPNYVVPVGYPR